MATNVNGLSLALTALLSIAAPISISAAMPPAWEAVAPEECARLTKKAWRENGWPAEEKKVPSASCVDFALFSSSASSNFLIHQDEYTGGGGFYRWFVLENLDEGGHPQILANDSRATARFTSIAGEVFLEQYDGESISLSRWRSDRLQLALKYRANDFAFQSGPVFGALRAFDPATKDFFIVKYEAKGREAILNARYSWTVDRYSYSSGVWQPTKADLPFSKNLKARLAQIDPHFLKQLTSAEKGNFTFDEDFGWSQR